MDQSIMEENAHVDVQRDAVVFVDVVGGDEVVGLLVVEDTSREEKS